jgi:hypothetical protein
MRFAVLHHTGWPGRPDHYDLLLQYAEGDDDNSAVLKTFATSRDEFSATHVQLKKIADHRRAYLEFQGELSGGRGRVARVDGGDLRIISNPGETWQDVRFALYGEKLRGNFRLHCANGTDFILESADEV